MLCDFHIHTSFSDGEVASQEVVRLYGESGFDVIGISDHIAGRRWPKQRAAGNEPAPVVREEDFSQYLQSL
jgi:predicted metal-dependent phosphoesterase TrpH